MNELIVDSTATGARIALLKDKRLLELHQGKHNSSYMVGDIYLGTVKKVMPSLNACFVDIGYEKVAFLHYHDLGPQVKTLNKFTDLVRQGKINTPTLDTFRSEAPIVKTGQISELYTKNTQVLVQVVKEPISTKGPRLSSEISLAGRYIILVPFGDVINISKKIKANPERVRLKRLIQSIKPKNFSVIIRTVAEGRSVEELHNDLNELVEKWGEVVNQLKALGNKPVVHQKILGEIDKTSTILRDVLNDDFSSIVVNDQTVYEEIKSFVMRISREKEKIVKFYNGKIPIFEHYGIDRQIKSSFGKTVTFSGGSYLVIEHTEAMHVIDVNSGSKLQNDADQEETAIKINIDATKEVARQLRLRDMGGIILVDFIDVRSLGNKRKLYQAMKDEMASDRAKHKILPLSTFGLMQITRQRVRPEMNIDTLEVCPMCKGSGEINSSIVITDEIEENLTYIIQNLNEKKVSLSAHPYIVAYLKQGWPSIRMRWYFKFKIWVSIESFEDYHYGEYHFHNSAGEEIKL